MLLTKSDRIWVRYHSRLLELIRIKGGRCECCGEDHISCLEFHNGITGDPKIKGFLSSSSGFIESKSLVSSSNLLCSNCHHDLHNPSKSGVGDLECSHCGYSGNSSCIVSDGTGGMICRNCIRKSRFDSVRYERLLSEIEGLLSESFSSKELDIGYLLDDRDWLSELDRLWLLEMDIGEMVDHLLVGAGLSRDKGIELLRGVISERIESGKLFHRGMMRYRLMSDSDLVRDYLVSRLIKFRELGWSRGRILNELGISRGRYDGLLRLLLDRDLIDYHRAPSEYIDIDSEIKRMSGLGMSGSSIARELGCKVSTVRYKRLKLIRGGLMSQPDYSSYNRGREPWNKGLKRVMSEETLTDEECLMIVMREDGKTAIEVSKELGRSLSWVRSRYSQMIQSGIISKKR